MRWLRYRFRTEPARGQRSSRGFEQLRVETARFEVRILRNVSVQSFQTIRHTLLLQLLLVVMRVRQLQRLLV